MAFQKSILACAAIAAFAAASVNALACSTVVVGKSVSATGHILIGHNEDNGGRIFNPQYYVPPAKHKAGEMITYEPTAAKIPQVPETLGFYWSQTLDPNGASFSDGFVNDAGVVIVSNACTTIYDTDQKLKDGGIGYGIRRLMAERAHTAKEAVDIAIESCSANTATSRRVARIRSQTTTRPGRSPSTKAILGWRAAFRTMKSLTFRTIS